MAVAEKTAFGYVKNYFEEHGERKRNCEINRIVQGCVGVRRTTGQHPGGIVVLPLGEMIYSFTPVQHPANDMATKTITTHFDYHSIDHNLLKLDILGHDDPTMIRMLQDLIGLDPVKDIPLDCREVMSLFQDTSALGITPEDIGGCKLGALGVPCGIATASEAFQARDAMVRLGLWKHFLFAFSSLQYGPKTGPDLYRAAARSLGSAPERTVVFEDALHAARSAKRAGFLVAGLSFLVGLFYLIAKLLFWQSFRAGYAPTMIAIFFMGGIQLAFLGFLGEYVMAMNTRIMNRPLVVEEERLNFGPDDQ